MPRDLAATCRAASGGVIHAPMTRITDIADRRRLFGRFDAQVRGATALR
ncbi:MAG: hypothetical protein ACU0BS_09075 [Hasllibacter sp.]